MPGNERPLITDYTVGHLAPSDGQWPVWNAGLGIFDWKSAAETGRQLMVPFMTGPSALWRWVNMPATGTFLLGLPHHIMLVDLSAYDQVRLVVNKQSTAGNAGAKFSLYYNVPPYSTTLLDYSIIGTSEVEVAIDTTNTILDSGWVDLATGAKADVHVAIIGSGGDGVLDPEFGQIWAQFR
jgi:hypothetical protein